ncbi:MAG: hypothetical protein HC833_02055 [Leptolyngbyaceae cyanobacterium RM1_406_9]|nr:hypothetical protein [Leptolyngbyaceae cyanobacterium RM1_406_9]
MWSGHLARSSSTVQNLDGACVANLPGCVAVGETLEEAKELIVEAIQFHLKGLREDGVAVPAPTSIVDYLEACGEGRSPPNRLP